MADETSDDRGPGYDLLTEEVYQTLRSLARRQLHRESRVVTLESSALVHEAWMRLAGSDGRPKIPRAAFVGIASHVMRQVLVDHARARSRLKRQRLTPEPPSVNDAMADIVTINKALERLERADPRKCRVIEMRFFGGCTVEETAEALGVSTNTVISDWNFGKRWLSRHLRSERNGH